MAIEPTHEEAIELIDNFINHMSMWYQFKDYVKEQGYTLQELGFEDPDEEEDITEPSNCSGQPCGECPYRTNSAPKYFGGNEPSYYAEAITKEHAVECHMTMGTQASKYCSGQAGVRVNTAKMSRDTKLREQEVIMKSREAARKLLFNNKQEFDQHHEIN